VGIDSLIEKEALPPVRAFGASFTGLDDVESGSGCAVRRGRRDFLLNSVMVNGVVELSCSVFDRLRLLQSPNAQRKSL
jgi:hypothetical protein